MKEFIITWEVEYYGVDEEDVTFPEDIINASPAKYYTKEWIEAEDLDSLMDDLGENIMDHTPEMSVPFHDGDFEIEWVLIHDKDGKEVYREPDFKLKDVPYE